MRVRSTLAFKHKRKFPQHWPVTALPTIYADLSFARMKKLLTTKEDKLRI
jgi:hypothetical protein